MSKVTLQLYADEMEAEGMGNEMSVTLYKVDPSQLVGQITLSELLDCWDIADIHDYVTEKLKDA